MQLTTVNENRRYAKSVKRIIYVFKHDGVETTLTQPKGAFLEHLESLPENAPFISTLVDADTLSLGTLVRA